MTATTPTPNIPHWIKKAVIYQIYPRSFQDSNGDGIGDLPGIIQRLDYLNDGTDKSLGIDAIWLSPMYPSPMKDFGYDVADYLNIDPIFGTLEDFDELVQAAHQRKIRIIMDYIPNHSSSQHPWFVESRSSLDNPKRDWYIWHDPKPDGSPPNNWVSVFGGSAWEFDEKTNQYYYHSFHTEQPDLNWRNPAVVAAMLDVLRFWLDRGVDGFRIDAYDFLFKHTSFLDEPPNPTYTLGTHGPHDALVHLYSYGQPEILDMIKQIAAVLEEYQHKFMVTEVYAPIDTLVNMYTHVSRDWYAPFNFGFISMPWTAAACKALVDEFDSKVGQTYFPTYVLGNHDQPRVKTRLGAGQARIAAMLQLTLRGIPFVYYGDEIGMSDGQIPRKKILDPFEINAPGLGLGRDPQRTPMQWSTDKQAGFSTVEPWLPIGDEYREVNVEAEDIDPSSWLNLYRQLIHLREQRVALYQGTYRSLRITNEYIFAYLRKYKQEKLLVVLNFSAEDQVIPLPYTKGKVLIDTLLNQSEVKKINFKHFHLLPHQGYVIDVTV